MDCCEGKWVIYDRRFRLKASASQNALWSVIDVTLWNMTSPERAIQSRQQAGSTPYASNLPNGHNANINTNQFAWTGTKILMDALGRPAASSIFATDMFIIPEPKTRITRPPSVHTGRRTGSTTNLDLIDLLFFPFFVN